MQCRCGFKQCLEVFFELANKMIDPRICATSFQGEKNFNKRGTFRKGELLEKGNF
jgi:hypothetical protein